ncbi:recombinase family protein [Coralloluteibacterium thermophilus]|uniref:Recombinase family protein n=1 Tax=Coralloluteibacterium thermophilum TaxID=2707049 RepID=A0ABV9NJG7_9GAMM
MRIAAYARYSSDSQREASLEDQLRNCRAYAARQGWPEPRVYTDAAVSGARNDRNNFLRLLADAPQYDVLLVDDLTRFGRDKDELGKTIKRLTFSGVRLIGVSDGTDTGRKGHKLDVGFRALMSEHFLDDLADKTHRGLTGRALDGASAGGLPYGYRVTEVGRRAIDAEQATVVRRIYAEYIDGASPRAIVSGLNRDRVPSPRGSTWSINAVRGDVKRGIGILANPIYVGRQIWNRSHWVKHPDTGRRVRQERPEHEWIVREKPELAIIDRATWDAAQARQRGRSKATGTAGRPPRHLLSGILRCGGCGGPMSIIDRYNYGCATAKARGGVCPDPMRVRIRDAEDSLLASIRTDLLTERRFAELQREVTARLRKAAPDESAARRRLAEAERVRENIMAAIRAGIITPSTKAELERAEDDVRAATAEIEAVRNFRPATLVPRLRERWERMVADLAEAGKRRPAARQAIAQLIGTATVRNENGDLVAEIAASESTLEQAQISLVAGAGFEPATFGL